MNLLLLSGESLSNKAWIEMVDQTLKPLFTNTRVLSYDHWETGEERINFEKEYAKLTSSVADLGEYVIFAKSIGSVLVAKGIAEKKLAPVKCVFVGAAWLVGERDFPGFMTWIGGFSIPTLFITKTADPVAPADKLRDLLTRSHVQNYEFVEIPGDNHKYEDLEGLKTQVTIWIKK
ncbi:hypothetical protein HY440_02480 [Candidatus Microgenomates bacterium]|nr:hypothetical protein [Candidatus Microgenomates bacterium]